MKNCKQCFVPITDPYLSLQNSLKDKIYNRGYADKVFIDRCLFCYMRFVEIENLNKNKYADTIIESLKTNKCIELHTILAKKLNNIKTLSLNFNPTTLKLTEIIITHSKRGFIRVSLVDDIFSIASNDVELFKSEHMKDILIFLIGYTS